MLGDEFIFYSAFVRSFDSSFGKVLENLGISIAKFSYKTQRVIDSYILTEQTQHISNLLDKFKDVVLVGGTGLYVRAALFDYNFEKEDVPVDEDLNELSNDELHILLEELDIEESKKIHVNNRKRLLRAISLIRHANKKKTDILNAQAHKPIYKDVKFIFISPNREELYQNIDKRVISMMENGLVDEVKCLLDKYNLSLTARQGIGYKEVIDYLKNKTEYACCVELIQKRTRNYAKRQVTFFKNQFECETYSSIEEFKKTLGGQ